ncbi:NUDIX domain-containing protein [Bacillus paramycoides]|uniref:NUDIX domain-containing protein n=1 Tax=Bacillus paramycoides TaxID=2026194 RepID=UPI002E1BB207|nr:NUDIX domain-containing protein [Bacillus paramycoides]MED0963157.1 NUDIX domain-containing protein [Bacillus paramycoides]
MREVKEETGLDVTLNHTTGVYNFTSDSNEQVILFHFIGEITDGEVSLGEEEIIDFKWINSVAILAMSDETLRNAKVIKQIINNILHKNFYLSPFIIIRFMLIQLIPRYKDFPIR